MRRFLLYAHSGRAAALEALMTVLAELGNRGVRAVITDEQYDQIRMSPPASLPEGLLDILDSEEVDVVDAVSAADLVELGIVLGGDGTILRALEVVREAEIPVHGVNLGHVGFLAESEVEELSTTVRRLLDGDYDIEERATLDIVIRGPKDQILHTDWALNDASLEKADRQKMIYVVIEIDGRPVSSFGCDGVLLTSPTGSTAYGFSAGGPIIWPEVDAFLVVPLAAHALFSRPLVLGRSSEAAIELTVENRDEGVLTLDGRRTIDITPGMRVEGRLSPRSVRLVRLTTTPFADRLVEKFQLPVVGWRGRVGRDV
ncbi:NAD kinase [Brachybacterium halotolerans subsp. kimchii]|uniref:NAD kinase n=1 Tax=Brachybacterium TaxID=43668 RepID=UPI001E5FAA00|nr:MULTISPECIES: NAD kinase [Brachybacterium]MCG7309936.1 NAD kinase [Brachybacterium sp. ACRRE]UEJ83413.1 NAD kinase [Brachybacterium halotolerans subsp. kimchii]